jgi:hypothetical protein
MSGRLRDSWDEDGACDGLGSAVKAAREFELKRHGLSGLGILMLASVLGALMTSTTFAREPSSRKIVVKREIVLMQGNAVALHSIVKTPDGGFVILGDFGHGWATRVTASGDVIWDYRDDGHSVANSHDLDQNSFLGALSLPDNSTLLCGRKQGPAAGDKISGYLVRLDAAGKVLSRLSVYPSGDKTYEMSSISRCFPWGDGFAVLGGASSGGSHIGWLMKLDAQGTKEWERIGPNYSAGSEAYETADHDLVVHSSGATLTTVILRRFNTKGEMAAERTIEQNQFRFIRAVEPSANVYAGIYRLSSLSSSSAEMSRSTSVASFDSKLQDLGPERSIKTISFDFGRAFMFPDQSLAIFGYVDLPDHSSTAAAAYVDSNFKEKSNYRFKPEHGSNWVQDAVALNTEGDFAVIRTAVSPDIKQVGILLSWVSIK